MWSGIRRLSRTVGSALGVEGMPAAVPGVGECHICRQTVPCVKVLDCGHTLCSPCASRLVAEAETTWLLCAECRGRTDVSKGVADLRTRYFGRIRCDVCLERKEAEDTWWCADCLMALCSKCSITQHSQRPSHSLSEWNQLKPVAFSVSYLNQLRLDRQNSQGTAHNETAVREYLAEVERLLLHQLRNSSEVDHLKKSLISRYGSRFSSDSSSTSEGGGVEPGTPLDDAPRILAKVFQIAGESVGEEGIPSPAVSATQHQLFFTTPASEIADFIRAKMQLVPVPVTPASAASGSVTPVGQPAGHPSAPQLPNHEHKVIPRVGGRVPVLQMIYCPAASTIAVRTGTEIQLYCVETGKTYGIPGQAQKNIRDICWGCGSEELLVTYQSTLRKFDWSLEAFRLSSFPVTSLYSAALDIDPEDRVEGVRMALTGPNSATLFEMRLCHGNVSEIWRGRVETKKKGKVKLKESLVCQRPNSAFTALQVAAGQGKESFLFAWDDLSACLYRLRVKDGKVYQATKVLHSSEPVPFRLDPFQRLWVFDPHLHQVCVSRAPVLDDHNVFFHQIWEFKEHGFSGLYWRDGKDSGPAAVLGLSLTPDHLTLTSFSHAPAPK